MAKTIALVTGGNSGIGFELVSQLLSKGTYHVFMGSRSLSKGNAALQQLQSQDVPGTVEVLELDMTKDSTIDAAVKTISEAHGHLDILVNNAAIVSTAPSLREQLQEEFDTNATGPAVLTNAFIPLLRKSVLSPRIINISSGAGSINRRLNPTSPLFKFPGVNYRASKTALNMITACAWAEYGPEVKVFAYDPGFTQSGLSGMNTKENGARSVGESVGPLVDVVEGKRDGEVGRFLHNTGEYPW
ncbi:hypothetical protein BJ875DRAFT_499202 [Amylocarpus encephaloides]|uniref:Short chain dehydrogenase n=1 Tax=Amylocarpus encephaloides TaxID=45428 RepID=A0A9P7YCA5_9HELO|nr:hypothetical protein BJ875DRAFT_499202 [Amylocarpus encephaloides]